MSSMQIGTCQIDITPPVGCELSGFAARTQPSTGVLDPLFARALYVADGSERLLWIHCDLIGLRRPFVQAFRTWAGEKLGLASSQVMVSATHTHSGPCTVVLHEAGQYDPVYERSLLTRLQEAAERAVASTEACQIITAEGRCDLAVDRRGQATAHTDPRVPAVAWRRADGTFAAVVVNYAMHAVALGPVNRRISADWPGRTAAALSRLLPGAPVVLVANGACGNLNSPAENVTPEQIDDWGGQVAASVADLLRTATPLAQVAQSPSAGRSPSSMHSRGGCGTGLRVASRIVALPMDVLDPEGIDAYADRSLRNVAGLSEWGDKFRRAITTWRDHMKQAVTTGAAQPTCEAELLAVRLADRVFIGVNAEMFSRFTDLVREHAGVGSNVYTIGYANGVLGYVAPRAAYDEGGYEVEMAHLFYDAFRPRPGGLELLAETAAELIETFARR